MALTEAQREARRGKIGASFAPALLAGNQSRIVEEWLRLTEHPAYVETDLSEVWAPSFGGWIEPFALDWHERKTGHTLDRRGEWVSHPTLPYIGCTLDAYRPADATVLDVKAPGHHRLLDDVLAYYAAQMVVQRACTGATHAALLVVHGGAEPREYALRWTPEYEREVWDRIAWFWGRVESLQPPGPLPGSTVPVEAVRIIDMQGNNAWGSAADAWLQHRCAARACETAAKSLRALVEADVREAYGHGVRIARDRAGRLLLKEDAA